MNTTPVYFTGIDIGSTASKTVVLKEGKIEDYFVLPTGWNGRETANAILAQLKKVLPDTVVAIEYVDEIAPTASGKLRYAIRECPLPDGRKTS